MRLCIMHAYEFRLRMDYSRISFTLLARHKSQNTTDYGYKTLSLPVKFYGIILFDVSKRENIACFFINPTFIVFLRWSF